MKSSGREYIYTEYGCIEYNLCQLSRKTAPDSFLIVCTTDKTSRYAFKNAPDRHGKYSC
jgi:hypothetical protein